MAAQVLVEVRAHQRLELRGLVGRGLAQLCERRLQLREARALAAGEMRID